MLSKSSSLRSQQTTTKDLIPSITASANTLATQHRQCTQEPHWQILLAFSMKFRQGATMFLSQQNEELKCLSFRCCEEWINYTVQGSMWLFFLLFSFVSSTKMLKLISMVNWLWHKTLVLCFVTFSIYFCYSSCSRLLWHQDTCYFNVDQWSKLMFFNLTVHIGTQIPKTCSATSVVPLKFIAGITWNFSLMHLHKALYRKEQFQSSYNTCVKCR